MVGRQIVLERFADQGANNDTEFQKGVKRDKLIYQVGCQKRLHVSIKNLKDIDP